MARDPSSSPSAPLASAWRQMLKSFDSCDAGMCHPVYFSAGKVGDQISARTGESVSILLLLIWESFGESEAVWFSCIETNFHALRHVSWTAVKSCLYWRYSHQAARGTSRRRRLCRPQSPPHRSSHPYSRSRRFLGYSHPDCPSYQSTIRRCRR